MAEDDDHCPCEDNLANLTAIDPGAGTRPAVAEAEVCDDRSCEVGHFLVRGDRVSFVSEAQWKQRGGARIQNAHRLPARVPSDIKIPSPYVFVNDAAGRLMDKCDIYIVKWRNSRNNNVIDIHEKDLAVAQEYFGGSAAMRGGNIDIPGGPWERVARVRVIRYRRFGFRESFAHLYATPVDLLECRRPLAWKLPLPDGCVIDSRGFVRP